ncbi:MAG: sigma-70 family RNA polymerase sigma factor [Saprospiraceae bacterium]
MQNESTIWDRLREGDESALKKIYEKYFNLLVNYGLRMSSHHEIVEDSVQELFIDLWNLKANLSPTDSVKNYLICSFRRKLVKKLKEKLKYSDDSKLEFESAAEPNFLNHLIQTEEDDSMQRKMSKALDLLSSRQKEAIFLKYQEGMDYEAICEAMNLQYQSVRNLISTAVARIRENIVLSLLLFISLEYIYRNIDFLN